MVVRKLSRFDTRRLRRLASLILEKRHWSHNFRRCSAIFSDLHGSLNVPIEHHPTIRYMVYNGYYKVMSNIPKMGHLPTPGFSAGKFMLRASWAMGVFFVRSESGRILGQWTSHHAAFFDLPKKTWDSKHSQKMDPVMGVLYGIGLPHESTTPCIKWGYPAW